jgi:hypothetical protein
MQLKALLLPVLAAGALASPQRPGWWHPRPTSTCLTDAAATSLAEAFSSMLTNPDRSAANATGQAIIADGYSETSDSILSLEHEPVGTAIYLLCDALAKSPSSSAPSHLPASNFISKTWSTHHPSQPLPLSTSSTTAPRSSGTGSPLA